MIRPLPKLCKYILAITAGLIIQLTALGQWKGSIGQYVYTGMPLSEGIVPVLQLQSPGDWHAELRYNYEYANTVSLYGGKNFSGGNNNSLAYTITPMAGFSTGRFTSISFASNTDAEWKNFFLSSQTQYSMAVKRKDSTLIKKNTGDFFFSWSELGYNIGDHFFGGLAMQYSRQAGENDFEPGFLAGMNFKGLSFPCYVFSPFSSRRYFILGINYEFSFKKKKYPVL